MTFTNGTYDNMISQGSEAQARMFPQYRGLRTDFDVIIVGTGVGGGILADDLADRSSTRRVLMLEAGSFLVPTHVYNVSRIPNTALAPRFACKTFWQTGDQNSQNYIHERPQLNFGGRSIFWSGLIPHLQEWELAFFPPRVRDALGARFLNAASESLNESVTLGSTAQAIVAALRGSELAQDFDIVETPRALHQPYLNADGTPRGQYFVEPTGVFNTSELLINQFGPTTSSDEGPGLYVLLNHYVEDVRALPGDRFELVARNTLTGEARFFQTTTAVLAAGSIESPKLLRRSSLFPSLPGSVRARSGTGLTDHPTTDSVKSYVTNLGDVPIPKDSSAKIIFYSRGRRNANNEILYPFNVEMNVNHEYWHLRENDANAPQQPVDHTPGSSVIDIKFSFGNCLDEANQVLPAAPFEYVPEIAFRNQKWLDHLAGSRFPALAGWHKSYPEIFATLNDITYRIFRRFSNFGSEPRPLDDENKEVWYGQGKGFGMGTVHHAVGTLRMPYCPSYTEAPHFDSVVDEDLRVIGTANLYVCDMSVLPFASAANPVRTLAALALRLSDHFG